MDSGRFASSLIGAMASAEPACIFTACRVAETRYRQGVAQNRGHTRTGMFHAITPIIGPPTAVRFRCTRYMCA